MYSVSLWWKCGHYPPIRSHIVVPVGSIHPSKVYSWGQASAPCIINRTELSAVHRIWLHLASRYRFELWNAAVLWTQKHSLIKMKGWVLLTFSLIHREMMLDLTICLLSLHSQSRVNIRQQAVRFTTLKLCLLCSQLKGDLLTQSLCLNYLDWQYFRVLFTMQRWRTLKIK